MSHKLPPTKLSQTTINKEVDEDYNDDYNENCNKDCMANCMTFSFIGTVLLAIILYFGGFFEDWKPFKPMEFIIADASISQFNLTSDNTLYYNFKFNITVRNPNYHDYMSLITITAISSYKGNEFAMVDMESFDPDSKKTILKPVVIYGNSLIKLNAQQLMEYDNETRLGIFNLDLKLDLKYSEYVYCLGLRVPLISNEKLESTFNVTKCSREYQGWG